MELMTGILAGLYALAMLILVVCGVQLLILALVAHRAPRHVLGDPLVGARLPTVTVQIPLYNESLVARRVIDAVASLDYPSDRLQIQVLDDSTDGTPEIAAERVSYWRSRGLGITHIRRSTRQGFKAGALANGLDTARGEYVAIFDADFCPAPDFLRSVLPRFDTPRTGLVQARWGHVNAAASGLTRVQAFGLDAHFAVEQEGRNRAGAFMSFNGTAGVWRRECIDDAGGWSADTLTEDLDLSYRAQLRGWTFRYVHDVEVPAELPAHFPAVRAQQYRWTKGAAETARKILGRFVRAPLSVRTRLFGSLHLTAHAAFPALLVASLLHAPLMMSRDAIASPVYFAALSLGFVGFVGFLLAHLVAQRRLHPDWVRRQVVFPLFMIGSIGLSAHNTMAIIDGLRRKRTPFIRTPKYGSSSRNGTRETTIPRVVFVEVALAVYSLCGLIVLAVNGIWEALAFQAMFLTGFATVAFQHLRDAGRLKVDREAATN